MQGFEEAATYIKELTDATNDGRMAWKSANPTTYVWETGTPTPARVIIQQVTASERSPGGVPRSVRNYVLQLFDIRTSSVRLSLTSKDSPVLAEALSALFRVASGGVTRAGLDFLKDVVPKK
jgi:hypothetical protein